MKPALTPEEWELMGLMGLTGEDMGFMKELVANLRDDNYEIPVAVAMRAVALADRVFLPPEEIEA